MTKQNESKPVVSQASLFKTEKTLAEAILKAEGNAASLQVEYQRIAASALLHLGKNKDIRIIRRILEQFPEGLRKNTMLAYFERFGQVTVQEVEKENAKGSEQIVVFDKAKKLDLAGALSTPWWKAAKEPVYKPFDLEAAISNIINLADKRMQKGLSAEKGDKVDVTKLNALKALVSKKA